MKKSILLFVCSAFLVGCFADAQKKVKGNGDVITQTRNTADYETINVVGPFEVNLVAGTEGEITLKGEENLLSAIKVEVEDQMLKIYKEETIQISPTIGKQIQVIVPFNEISAIVRVGSGKVQSKDVIKSDNFYAELVGSGSLDLAVESNNVALDLSGSGNARLKGTTNQFVAKLAGSGNIEASELKSNEVEANVYGSGSSSVNCNKNLVARVAGSGNIIYHGNPANRDTKVSGSGRITEK